MNIQLYTFASRKWLFAEPCKQSNWQKLGDFRRSVDDVDLYVGGFLETAHADSILGPTFKCIIGDQFARLKLGDRFFYDLGRDPKSRFSSEQLQEIRKTSMARVLCDNTESLRSIQPLAFKLSGSSSTNALESCRSRNIPSMNLRAWRGGWLLSDQLIIYSFIFIVKNKNEITSETC